MSRPPADQPGDHEGYAPIVEAARLLGVSENAVRQRIKRKTIPAMKVDGVWLVAVADHGGDHQHRPVGDREDRLSRDHEADRPADQEATVLPVSTAAYAQLAAIRDEWVLPLTARIEELAQENGAIVERITAVSAERDRAMHDKALAERKMADLQAEVERLQTAQEAPAAHEDAPQRTEPVGAASTPSRPWWRRLLGLGG